MKFQILPEIQIGGRKVRIRISERVLQIADLSAQASTYDNIIRLTLHYEGHPRNNVVVFESLIHEILHIIDRLYMRELEERQVGALSSGLAQALISLGIEPDFSQIPEEER